MDVQKVFTQHMHKVRCFSYNGLSITIAA